MIYEEFYDFYRTVLTNCRRCSDEGNPRRCMYVCTYVDFFSGDSKLSNDLTVSAP